MMYYSQKTDWKDLFISLFLGIGFAGLLGFLIGLRVIDMTPDLVSNIRNVIFLTLSSVYLYWIVGLAVGLFIWIFLWSISHLFNKFWHGNTFVAPWVKTYLIAAGILFIYLALTRQNLRAGNFDNFLMVSNYVISVFFSILLIRCIRPKRNVLTGKRSRLTLTRFFGVLILFSVVAIGLTLVSVNTRDVEMVLGEESEINEALANPNRQTRVVIIGWDGGEWSVIDDLIEAGKLPNFRSLVENGISAPLRSLPSTKSPLVWTSIATGKSPDKHGITNFGSFQFPGMVNNFSNYPDGLGYYRLISNFMRRADLPVSSSTRRVEAIWNLLSQADLEVANVGWWATWPAEQVNGYVVSDRFTYSLFNPISSVLSLREGQTHPPELIDEIDQFCRLPDSITDEEYDRFNLKRAGRKTYPVEWRQDQYQDWNPMYQFRLAFSASESYRKAGLYLYQKEKPALFNIYFQGIDMVSHFFWQYYRPHEFIDVPSDDVRDFGNVIPEFYVYMDDILGEFLSIIDSDTDIIVLSDHGFGFDRHPDIAFRTGEHRLHGIFAASGPHFPKGLKIDELDVLDVMPTILHLFGLPAASDMDGKIREDILDVDFISESSPTYIRSYETGRRISAITRSKADKQVRDQIKALGYTN